MRIALHTPFGSVSQESGLLYLLANYLTSLAGDAPGHELLQLQCNGAFSLCDRDADRDWKRGLHSCLSCMKDQETLAAWGKVPFVRLTSFLSPEDIERTKRWALLVNANDLEKAEFDGLSVYQLVAATLQLRGKNGGAISGGLDQQVVRRLMLSAARMIIASHRFLTSYNPERVFVASGRDFLSSCLAAVCEVRSVELVTFRWSLEDRAIRIDRNDGSDPLKCELILEGLPLLRSDYRTWSATLLTILDSVLEYLRLPRVMAPAASARLG